MKPSQAWSEMPDSPRPPLPAPGCWPLLWGLSQPGGLAPVPPTHLDPAFPEKTGVRGDGSQSPLPTLALLQKTQAPEKGKGGFSTTLWGFRKLVRVESGCSDELGVQKVVYLGSGERVNPREVESQGEAKSQSVFSSLVSQPYQEVLPQVSLRACFSSLRMGQTRTISMTLGAFSSSYQHTGSSSSFGSRERILAYGQNTGGPGVGVGGGPMGRALAKVAGGMRL